MRAVSSSSPSAVATTPSPSSLGSESPSAVESAFTASDSLASVFVAADSLISALAAADSLSRMWTIIDRTLTLAKQGQHVGEKDPVELSTVAQRCWSSVDTESATLTVDSDARILADADRLRNLFENLLRNAVEHSSKGQSSKERKDGVDGELPDPTDATADDGGVPASGSAAVRDVRSGTGPVLVRVGVLDGEGFYLEDDAGGIPPDDRDRVFDLGYSTEADGTGYGLAIVKWIAEAHGWDVAATESSDGGARFEFTDVEFA